MGSTLKNYQTYLNIRKNINHKRNESLQKAIQSQINHYENITENFVHNIHHQIKEKPANTISGNILTKEKSNYASRLYEEINKTIPLYDTLINDLNKPFKLFVMGPGNYGKSTVINSLLGTGEAHAPENVLPLTWKIDIFEDNDNDNEVSLIYSAGETKKVSRSKARAAIEKEEKEIMQSKKAIREKLKTIVKEKTLSPSEIKEFKVKLEREEVYHSKLVEAQWRVKGSALLKQFSIVDTPGLDQVNFSGEVKKNAIDYYHKSDGVIWILDAVTINAKNSAKMLQELEESLDKIGGSNASNNMIAVLNRMDLVNQKPGQAQEVIDAANQIFKDKFKAIVPYSALQSFNAMKYSDMELKESSGRNRLIKVIQEVFYMNANQIQVRKKEESCLIYNRKNHEAIETFALQLETDNNRFVSGIDKITERLNNELQKLQRDFINILDRYLSDFENNIEDHLVFVGKMEDKSDQRRYLHKNAYRIEYLNQTLKDYSAKASKNYQNLAKQLINEYYFSQYKSLDKYRKLNVTFPDVEPIYITNLPDTWMPGTGMSAAVAGGAGLIFGPIGGIIGAGVGYLFSNEMKKEGVSVSIETAGELAQKFNESFQACTLSYFEEGQVEVAEKISDSFGTMYNMRWNKDSPVHETVGVKANKAIEICVDTLKEYERTDIKFIPDIKALIFG